MFTVTLIKDFVKIAEYIPFEDFLNRVKFGAYAHLIKPIRSKIKEDDLKGANFLKSKLPAIASSGNFNAPRNYSNLISYSHAVVLDIDKLTEEQLIELKQKICSSPYTLACFVSPSGRGLKVFVCVSTEAKDHRMAFLALQQYYQNLTGVKIDASGKDIARLCFVSYDPDLYYNPGATIFTPTAGTVTKDDSVIPVGPGTIDEVYKSCIALVERKHTFIEGSRHDFVFNLALMMRNKGLSEATTRVLLIQDYSYDVNDLLNCVNSVYGYDWTNQTPAKKPASPAQHQPVDEDFQQPVAPEDDPDAGPPAKKKKGPRRAYQIEEVERLLRSWYDTRYNEVTNMIEWRKVNTNDKFVSMVDHGENSVFRQLHHAGQFIPRNTLNALLNSDFSPSYNPFLEYFNSLPAWDTVTDYIGMLARTVKTKDDVYWEICFRKWFVAYVASLVNDETINHTVIVLVGEQGLGKTSWMKQLLPPELQDYLGLAILQPDSKDTSIMVCINALVILDEMETLNKKDLPALKELITRPKVRIRRPFGHNTENLPHRASFIAGVNYQQVLNDPSGTRRYLCTYTLQIDYQHNVDINCVMAQALALYKSGFRFWFNMDEIKELEGHNIDFVSKSIEEEMINIWLRPATLEEWNSRNQFVNGQNIQLLSASEIADFIITKAKIMLNDGTIVKIGKIMAKMGFERVRRGNGHAYRVRILDAESVERSKHVQEPDESLSTNQVTDNHESRSNADLFSSSDEEPLPF